MSVASYKYALSPGVKYVNFVPGVSVKESFSVFSREETSSMGFEIRTEPDRESQVYSGVWEDLGKHVSIENSSFVLEAGEEKIVYLNVEMPADLRPGKHRASLLVVPSESNSESNKVGTSVTSVFQLFVAVPFPGKYAEIRDLSCVESEPGKKVKFKVSLWNLGSEKINSARALIEIFDLNNKKLSVISSEIATEIESGGLREILVFMDVSNTKPGLYTARAKLQYDGAETEEAEIGFVVGQMLVELAGLSRDYLRSGEINELGLIVDSKWNREIKDASAKVFLEDSAGIALASAETANFNLKPWERKEISAFLDLSHVPVGDYKIKVMIKYGSKSTEFYQNIRVEKALVFGFNLDELELEKIGFGFLVLIFILAVISARRNIAVAFSAIKQRMFFSKAQKQAIPVINVEDINSRIDSLNKTAELLERTQGFLAEKEKKLELKLEKIEHSKSKKKKKKLIDSIQRELAVTKKHRAALVFAAVSIRDTAEFLFSIAEQIKAVQSAKKEQEENSELAYLYSQKNAIKEKLKSLERLKEKGKLGADSHNAILQNLNFELDELNTKIAKEKEKTEPEKILFKEIIRKENELKKSIQYKTSPKQKSRAGKKKPLTKAEIEAKLEKARELLLSEKIDQKTYSEIKRSLEKKSVKKTKKKAKKKKQKTAKQKKAGQKSKPAIN